MHNVLGGENSWAMGASETYTTLMCQMLGRYPILDGLNFGGATGMVVDFRTLSSASLCEGRSVVKLVYNVHRFLDYWK